MNTCKDNDLVRNCDFCCSWFAGSTIVMFMSLEAPRSLSMPSLLNWGKVISVFSILLHSAIAGGNHTKTVHGCSHPRPCAQQNTNTTTTSYSKTINGGNQTESMSSRTSKLNQTKQRWVNAFMPARKNLDRATISDRQPRSNQSRP